MKMKYLAITIISIPLLVVFVAIFGITFNVWTYLLLFILCPLAAGILWFIYRDMEKKLKR
jgi:predicted membrane protein